MGAAQAALTSWVQLCEAMASWRIMQDEGLRNELTVLMQAFKANLVSSLLTLHNHPRTAWPQMYMCMGDGLCDMVTVLMEAFKANLLTSLLTLHNHHNHRERDWRLSCLSA